MSQQHLVNPDSQTEFSILGYYFDLLHLLVVFFIKLTTSDLNKFVLKLYLKVAVHFKDYEIVMEILSRVENDSQ